MEEWGGDWEERGREISSHFEVSIGRYGYLVAMQGLDEAS